MSAYDLFEQAVDLHERLHRLWEAENDLCVYEASARLERLVRVSNRALKRMQRRLATFRGR